MILVAYFPDTKTACFTIGTAIRKDPQTVIEMQNGQGKFAETWMGFLSNDEEHASDSVYCGKVNW